MASTKEKAEIVPVTIQVNDIGNLIYTIRDKQVMLDHDLAALYGYEVRALNQQVKRNIGRFPDDLHEDWSYNLNYRFDKAAYAQAMEKLKEMALDQSLT